MQLAQRRYWVFDMDGTLTRAIHDFEFIRYQLGVPQGDDILAYLQSLPNEQAAARYAWLYEHEHALALRATAATGAQALLSHLSQHGVHLGILTRNIHPVARLTLEHIGVSHYFPDATLLGRNEAAPKPDPAGLLKLASGWNVTPDTLVMVGDSLLDVETGRAAGALTILIQPTPDKRAHLADLWVPDARALLAEVFDA